METYYQVTYKTEKGLEVTQKRDTVERGYYLYKNLVSDFIEDGICNYNIKLEEVSNNGIALLRAEGEYKPKETEPTSFNSINGNEVDVDSICIRVWSKESDYNEGFDCDEIINNRFVQLN